MAKAYTLNDFMNGVSDEGDASLYVVRRGDKALYVGKASRGIAYRWFGARGHLSKNAGGYWYGNTPVGHEIEESLPESLSWFIDMYTIEECHPLIKKHCPHVVSLDRADIDDAERALIDEFNPLLNTM